MFNVHKWNSTRIGNSFEAVAMRNVLAKSAEIAISTR